MQRVRLIQGKIWCWGVALWRAHNHCSTFGKEPQAINCCRPWQCWVRSFDSCTMNFHYFIYLFFTILINCHNCQMPQLKWRISLLLCTDPVGGTMILRNATEPASGTYKCIAKNRIGTEECSVEVNITQREPAYCAFNIKIAKSEYSLK